MSRLAELAPWMAYAALLGGIALMVKGVRCAAPVKWGFWFGFASNSTPLGKVVEVAQKWAADAEDGDDD